MNKKLIGSLSVLLVLTCLTTGCGTVTLKNGEKAAVTMKKSRFHLIHTTKNYVKDME